jgi:hypothetical protein
MLGVTPAVALELYGKFFVQYVQKMVRAARWGHRAALRQGPPRMPPAAAPQRTPAGPRRAAQLLRSVALRVSTARTRAAALDCLSALGPGRCPRCLAARSAARASLQRCPAAS